MQHRTVYALALTALAGCATQVDPTTVSDFDICRYTMRGGKNAMVAQQEASRRGLDCTEYYPAIIGKDAADSAATAAAIQMLNASRQQPPPQRPLNCQTYRVGSMLQTDCR